MSHRRVTILTGPGKLHLFEAARVLSRDGNAVTVVSGWMPAPKGLEWLDSLGRLLGQPNLHQRISGRRAELEGYAQIKSCALAECGHHALGLLSRTGIIDEDLAGAMGFTLFGYSARRRIDGAEVIHVRSGAGRGGAIEYARRHGIKVVVDHSIAHPDAISEALTPEYERYGMKCPINGQTEFWKLVLRDCEEADVLLVNSDYVKNTFKKYGFPDAKQQVVYWGVGEEFWGIKSSYESEGPIKLLFSGHFELRKGARVLLEACQILKARGVRFKLQVLGFMGSGRLALAEFPVGKEVEFVAFAPRSVLIEHLRKADLFVFPTLAEGSARSAMEAMAAGLPVITTESCGVPIEDGVNGVYVELGSAKSLADAIERLSQDQTARMRLGMKARESISSRYTWEAFAQSVSGIYDRLLSHRSALQ